MCIAHRFAVQEAVLTLAHLYRTFTFRLASEEPLALRMGISVCPENGLPVYVARCNRIVFLARRIN